MKELKEGITTRQAVTTLLVATLAMLLVPVGAEAGDKLVSIFDQDNGVSADVSPDGALEVGDDQGPLTVDGAVNVEPGGEPIMIDGAVEIDEESQPISVDGSVNSIPGLPENRFQFGFDFAVGDLSDYEIAAPYVAVTSVTATNTGDDVLSVILQGSYSDQRTENQCHQGGKPVFRLQVQPHTTTHVDLPVPLVFQPEEPLCGDDERVLTHSGFTVRKDGPGFFGVIGFHG